MKRDKTAIGRVALSLVALAFALGSCMQEPIRLSMPGGDGMMVRVTFPSSVATRTTTRGTEVGSGDENRLERITILVFNQDGTKLETVLSEDVTSTNGSLATSHPQWASEGTLLVSPIQSPSSPKKIYAVANWGKTVFDKVTYTEATLKEELTTIASVADINGNKAYPMLMSGSKEVTDLTSASYSVTVDMERQAAKIKTLFSIPVDVQNDLPGIEWQTELMQITVVNVPNQSYIVSRAATPSASTLLNSDLIAVDDTQPAVGDQTVPPTKELKWSESLYINENPVAGTTPASKDASTSIVVQLPYKNRITGMVSMDNYYQLYINDTRDAVSPHRVLRNTIYNLSIRIRGMGLPFNKLVPDANVDNQLTVNGWEKGEMGDVEFPTYYFNIDRTYLELESVGKSLQSNIVTNVPDWKLVKADGATLFSFAEGIIAQAAIDGVGYTLSGSVSNATVTADRPADLKNFPINKMTLIAKNLKVPFMVAMGIPPPPDSFIPNSILIAAGWPAETLPPTGLQLAKRGDKVLPSGVAETYDIYMRWFEGGLYTSGTSTAFGTGISNTATLAGAEYPAAQNCRDMGTGWFLPSKDELLVIHDNHTKFGADYTFEETDYWTSSEYNEGDCWLVYSYNGYAYTNILAKVNRFKVRCVRYV